MQTSFPRRIVPLSLLMFLEIAAGACLMQFAFLFRDAEHMTRETFFLYACFLLPYLIFQLPAGFLADRMPKRLVLISCKAVEFVLLAVSVRLLGNGMSAASLIPVLLCLMSIKAAFFSPALNGMLPELFPEEELSLAVGKIGFSAFTAAALYLPVSLLLRQLFRGSFEDCLKPLVFVSVCGLVVSCCVVHSVSAVQRRKEAAYPFRAAFQSGWMEIIRTPQLFLSSLGDGFFLAVGSVLQLLIAQIVMRDAPGNSAGHCLSCVAAPAGMAAGCWLAGRISRKKIELGLIPFGAFLVALSLPLAAFLQGDAAHIQISIPRVYSDVITLHPWILLFMFLAGIGGGLFVIPLRSYFLHRVKPEAAGAAWSAGNVLCILFVIALHLAALCLVPDLNRTGRGIFSPGGCMTVLGLATFLVTAFSMWKLPDFALRFLIIALGSSFYRTRIRGAENIPQRGPALLLSNHVSLIDSVLISSCTSRHVRFLMQENYYRYRLLSAIARITGFIRVPDGGGKSKSMHRMLDEVKEALRNGEIICVFPEGRMTRNGVMSAFKGGYEKMIPGDVPVPVIPVCIGNVWGSIFSCYYGKFALRLPKKIPYSPTVSFGAPMTGPYTPFTVRQRIAELAVESNMERLHRERTLHYLVLRNAGRHPFRIQMRDAGGEGYTRLQTVCSSVLLSRAIRERMPSDARYVGILMPNSCLEAVSLLAALYADRIPVPLNASAPAPVLAESVRKAGIRLILTTRRFHEQEKEKIPPGMDVVFPDEILSSASRWKFRLLAAAIVLLPCKEMLALISPLSYDDVFGSAVLLFSSGSTGCPKGVLLTHHNMYTNVTALADAIRIDPGGDHVIGNLPLFHSFGLNVGFWLPLLHGFEVSYTESPLDAVGVSRIMENGRPTLLFATPSFLHAYLRRCTAEQFRGIRLVLTGAEKLREDIQARYRAMTGKEVIEAYGCTELSPVVSVNLTGNIDDLGLAAGHGDSIGVALNNISTRVLDPVTRAEVPPDTEGILFVRGPNVMSGYLNDRDLTARVLMDGYYDTGDVVRMDKSGYLTICGRLSRFSKIAGEMVPHEMVERIINEMFPHAERRVVAVCGIPDPAKGEALLVFYTPDMTMTPSEVVEELRERSISNLWIPKAVNFHPVETLPQLGSGKLDLHRLRIMADRIAEERKLAFSAR